MVFFTTGRHGNGRAKLSTTVWAVSNRNDPAPMIQIGTGRLSVTHCSLPADAVTYDSLILCCAHVQMPFDKSVSRSPKHFFAMSLGAGEQPASKAPRAATLKLFPLIIAIGGGRYGRRFLRVSNWNMEDSVTRVSVARSHGSTLNADRRCWMTQGMSICLLTALILTYCD